MSDTVNHQPQWCLVIWRWALGKTIKESYVYEILGPLSRQQANSLAATIYADKRRRVAQRVKLKAIESEMK